jgi:RNA polymerase sigma factor (sigma-70 family)
VQQGDDPARLVVDASAGDARAWEALVDRFADLVWSVARAHGLSHADAGDVSQTTWLHLAEHIGRIKEPEKVGAWLITTARRESLRTIRGVRRNVPVEDSPDWRLEDPTNEVDERLADMLLRAHLRSAFDSLAEPCRQLLRILMSEPPPSYADVSDALGIPIGSIGPTRARCLERLRQLLAREERLGARSRSRPGSLTGETAVELAEIETSRSSA